MRSRRTWEHWAVVALSAEEWGGGGTGNGVQPGVQPESETIKKYEVKWEIGFLRNPEMQYYRLLWSAIGGMKNVNIELPSRGLPVKKEERIRQQDVAIQSNSKIQFWSDLGEKTGSDKTTKIEHSPLTVIYELIWPVWNGDGLHNAYFKNHHSNRSAISHKWLTANSLIRKTLLVNVALSWGENRWPLLSPSVSFSPNKRSIVSNNRLIKPILARSASYRGDWKNSRSSNFGNWARMRCSNESLHPDSQTSTVSSGLRTAEIDAWRLFDNDAVAREIDARFERVQQYLASGDLDGLREFIEAEKAKSRA